MIGWIQLFFTKTKIVLRNLENTIAFKHVQIIVKNGLLSSRLLYQLLVTVHLKLDNHFSIKVVVYLLRPADNQLGILGNTI